MKKAISLFLAAIMCLTIFTLSTPVAFAASYSGTCGSGMTWSLSTSDGTLTVSGSGQMDDYSLSSAPSWDKYQNYIKSVVFDDGVTYVGDYAFYNGGNGYKYKKLVSVDFGSVESIGDYAFRGCAALSTITGSDSVVKIYSNAFRGCTALTEFSFSSINEICEGAFYNSGLESISLPETARTIRSSAFEGCKNASEITIPRYVSIIKDRAFADCTNVSSLKYNAASVSTIGLGVFNNTGAADGMTLEIGAYVTKIPDEIFSGCYTLNEIAGGNSVATIGKEAFACTAITEFEINAVLSTLDQSAFSGCSALEEFTVNENNEYFSANDEGILFNKTGSQLLRYPSGKTAVSYTLPSDIDAIAIGAFRDTVYLKYFSADSNISKIPQRAFLNSTGLETVNLAENISVIDTNAFTGCVNLESVTMNGVTQLNNYSFSQCESLTALPRTSALKTIGDFAFYDCDGLTTVNIPSGVTMIGKHAFFNCKNLTTLFVPSTVKTICEGAFSDCIRLSSVTLQSGISEIQKNAFADCDSLRSVTVPSSVTTIGQTAFGFKYNAGNSMTKITGFSLIGGNSSAAQAYATENAFPYTITEAAYESETITIDSTGSVVPAADTAEEDIDPMFTFGGFDSILSFIKGLDFAGLFEQIITFITEVIDFIRGTL